MNKTVSLCIAIIAFACNTKDHKPKSEITIKAFTIDGEVKKDSTYNLDSDYFEVTLSSVRSSGDAFIASKDTKRAQSMELHMAYLNIVDKEGNAIEFKTPTDFLNFMASGGYDMVDQKKTKYATDYTFKKKP